MNKRITGFLILFLVSISISARAQITYESGYFIKESGERVECEILNSDWLNNPDSFSYRLDEESGEVIAKMDNVIEFGVYGVSKYEKHTVKVDLSSSTLNTLSTSSLPEFEERTVFLKVVLQGKASLYKYTFNGTDQFYYSTDNESPEVLIYKEYKVSEDKIAKNNTYQEQLSDNLSCEGMKSILLDYYEKKLTDYFKTYNTCLNEDFEVFKGAPGFSVNIVPKVGLIHGSIDLEYTTNSVTNFSFDPVKGFVAGVGVEVILPYNKNKWAVLIEPSLISLKGDGVSQKEIVYTPTSSLVTDNEYSFDYTAIDVAAGVRHYLYLNSKTAMFVNLLSSYSFELDSKLSYGTTDYEIDPVLNVAAGIGAQFVGIQAELRYDFNRELLPSEAYYELGLKMASFRLSYSF